MVLISGGGSNLKALLEAADSGTEPYSIVAVGADTDASGLEFAAERGIPTFITRPQEFKNRDAWGEAFLSEIEHFAPDLVVSAGLMRILPTAFVETLSPKLINTHPALLPLYPGAHAVRDALVAGAEETGVTVHIIDAGVDTGPIIHQRTVQVMAGETEAELHERIKAVERPLLLQTIREIASGLLVLENVSHQTTA